MCKECEKEKKEFEINKDELERLRAFLKENGEGVCITPIYVLKALLKKIDELEQEKKKRLKLVVEIDN